MSEAGKEPTKQAEGGNQTSKKSTDEEKLAKRDEADKQLARYREAFNALDTDGSGKITTDELKSCIKMMRIEEEVPEYGLKALIDLADMDNDGTVSWDEFIVAVTEGVTPTNFLKARCRMTFAVLDTDNSGYLTPDELKQVAALSGYGETLTEDEQVQAIMDAADKDRDGKISFEEFLAVVAKHYDEKA